MARGFQKQAHIGARGFPKSIDADAQGTIGEARIMHSDGVEEVVTEITVGLSGSGAALILDAPAVNEGRSAGNGQQRHDHARMMKRMLEHNLSPETLREPADPVSEALEVWRTWHHAEPHTRGYPSRSIYIRYRGGMGVDDLEQDCDARMAEAVAALVDDLPTGWRRAIYHRWLGSVWPGSQATLLDHVRYAEASIGEGLRRRGMFE